MFPVLEGTPSAFLPALELSVITGSQSIDPVIFWIAEPDLTDGLFGAADFVPDATGFFAVEDTGFLVMGAAGFAVTGDAVGVSDLGAVGAAGFAVSAVIGVSVADAVGVPSNVETEVPSDVIAGATVAASALSGCSASDGVASVALCPASLS